MRFRFTATEAIPEGAKVIVKFGFGGKGTVSLAPGQERCENCGSLKNDETFHVFNSLGSCWIERK